MPEPGRGLARRGVPAVRAMIGSQSAEKLGRMKKLRRTLSESFSRIGEGPEGGEGPGPGGGTGGWWWWWWDGCGVVVGGWGGGMVVVVGWWWGDVGVLEEVLGCPRC